MLPPQKALKENFRSLAFIMDTSYESQSRQSNDLKNISFLKTMFPLSEYRLRDAFKEFWIALNNRSKGYIGNINLASSLIIGGQNRRSANKHVLKGQLFWQRET